MERGGEGARGLCMATESVDGQVGAGGAPGGGKRGWGLGGDPGVWGNPGEDPGGTPRGGQGTHGWGEGGGWGEGLGIWGDQGGGGGALSVRGTQTRRREEGSPSVLGGGPSIWGETQCFGGGPGIWGETQGCMAGGGHPSVCGRDPGTLVTQQEW